MLAVDQISTIKTGTGSSLVSDSLTTTIPDEMLIAICTADGFFTGGTGSFSVSDNKSNTWNLLKSNTANGSQVFVFYATVATVQSGITVTATRSGGTGDGITLQVFSVGASDTFAGIGAIDVASISAAAISKSITTTVANSMVFAAYANTATSPDNTTQVVGASQTAIGSYKGTVTHGGAEVWRQTSNVGSIGSVTMNLTAPSSGTGSMVVFEIIPINVGAAIKTSFATSVTSMPVDFPSGIVSGNMLIAICEVRNISTWSTIPTGWTQLFSPISAGGVGDFTVFYRKADGTEGSSATWVSSVATTASWQVRRITDWDGTAVPEVATANSGGSVSTNNPPSLTPSWGADNTIWLAVMGTTASGTAITGAPINYVGLVANSVSTGGSQCNTGSAYRINNASSEDPGSFTTGSDRWWVAATIAIKPVAAAGTSNTKDLSEVITVIDSFTRQPGKVISNNLILVDTLAKEWTLLRAYTEIVTIGDSIAKQIQRIFSSTVTITQIVVSSFGKVVGENLTIQPTFLSGITKFLSETLTLADVKTATINFAKDLDEAVTLVDSLINTFGKVVNESIIIVDQSVKRSVGFLLSGTITIVSTIVFAPVRLFNEIVTLTDTISHFSHKVLSEVVNIVDTKSRQIGRAISESTTIIDAIDSFSGLLKDMTEVMSIVDNFIRKAGVVLSDPVTITDRIIIPLFSTLSETITIVASFGKNIGRIIPQTISIMDSIVNVTGLGRAFSEAIIIKDKLYGYKNGIRGVWEKTSKTSSEIWKKVKRRRF